MRSVILPNIAIERIYAQLAEFLSSFNPWEVEEIRCVHDYMLKRLDLVTEQLEDEFIQSIVDADQKIAKNEDLAQQASESVEARLICISKILHPQGSEHTHCLGLSQSLFEEGRPEDYFSIHSKSFQGRQMEALASLGAPFMQSFIEGSSKTKLDLIYKYRGTWCYPLDESLQDSFFPEGPLRTAPGNQVTTFERDSIQCPNKAWIWAKQNNAGLERGYYRPCDRDLRALGFVFWDSDRLEKKMRLMNEARPKMKWASPADLAWERHGTNHSAEQRLRDMGFVLSWPYQGPQP